MLIQNPDSLRTWLTSALEPICDADPAALAKYVMALLKKDKSELDLKDFCIEQLDVFLQAETRDFVDRVFEAIANRSYIPSVASAGVVEPVKKANSVSSEPLKPSQPTVVSSSQEEPKSSTPSPNRRRPTSGRVRSPLPPVTRSGVEEKNSSYEPRRGETRRRISPPPREPTAERRRNSDRERRSRSNERNGRRRTGTTTTTDSRGSRSGRHYREGGRRPRSRSPRTPPRRRSSREASPKSSTEALAKPSREGEVLAEKNSSSPLPEVADTEENREKQQRKRKKERCRDYDEKGYCMKGDRCPYDHGPDPVVVNDSALPTMISVGTKSSAAPPPPPLPNFSVPPPGYTRPPISLNPPPPGVDSYAPTPVTSSSSGSSSNTEGYNPEAPAISSVSTVVPAALPPNYSYPPPPLPSWGPRGPSLPPFPFMPPIMPPSGPNRDHLITLAEPEPYGGSPKRGRGGIQSRLGPRIPYHMQQGMRHPGPAMNRENKTLEVRKIPPALNNIAKLNEHFQQFGQITNMQVRYQGDPEAALITFVTKNQAQAAYRSTSPILNNRFIKVFWHNPTKDEEEGPGGAERSDASANKSDVEAKEQGIIIRSNEVRKESEAVVPQEPPKPLALVPTARELVAAQKSAKRKERERRMAYLTLQKKKTELMQKQVEQQKSLVARIEHAKDPAMKKELVKMFKVMDKSVKKLKEELTELGEKLSELSTTKNRTKEIVEKETLDLELELMSQQQAGGDTGSLQKRLTDLKSELLNLARSGGNGGAAEASEKTATGRRNKMIPKNSRLDKRPRNIVVTGFAAEDKDAVIQHLEKFGEMEDIEFDCKDRNGGCRALGVYKTRLSAERAVGLGGDLTEEKKVAIGWGVVAGLSRTLSSSGETAERKPDTTGPDLPEAPVERTSEGGESDSRMTAEELLASINDGLSSDSGGEDNKDDAFEEDEEEEEENEKGWKR